MVVCDYAKKAVLKARQMKALKLLREVEKLQKVDTYRNNRRVDMLLTRYEEHYLGTW